MDDPTKPAEHVSHDLTRLTISAISRAGRLSVFLAAVTILWTFWRFRSDREEKKAKERKKEEKDEKRRKMADEEDARTRERQTRETRRDGRGRTMRRRRGWTRLRSSLRTRSKISGGRAGQGGFPGDFDGGLGSPFWDGGGGGLPFWVRSGWRCRACRGGELPLEKGVKEAAFTAVTVVEAAGQDAHQSQVDGSGANGLSVVHSLDAAPHPGILSKAIQDYSKSVQRPDNHSGRTC